MVERNLLFKIRLATGSGLCACMCMFVCVRVCACVCVRVTLMVKWWNCSDVELFSSIRDCIAYGGSVK